MQLISSVLVGRDTELRHVAEVLAAARGGRGGTTLLFGEAGIGKSRLVAEAEVMARTAGMAVLCGRASSVGTAVPFRPLAEAVLSLGRLDGPPEDPELAPFWPVLGSLVPEWRDHDAPPQRGSLLVLAESMLRLVTAAGRESGSLVVLEDLHDADAETLAVVEYLVDHMNGRRGLLLLTARQEMGPVLTLARSAQRRRACQVLELSRLDDAQVRTLIGHCLRVPPSGVPGPVAGLLCRDGDGNPFVVEELLAGFMDAGALTRRNGGAWSVAGEVTAILPTTVIASIANRAERLGPAGHTLLKVAAMFGRRFPLSAVRAVAGDDQVAEHLRAAITAQLVVADEPAPDWYSFRHALTADALLAPLVPLELAQLARRLADELETRYPDLPGQWCLLVARLRLTAGQTSAAAHFHAEAGRRALANSAAASAVTLLEKAYLLAASEDTQSSACAGILASLVEALTEAGHLTAASEHLSRLEGLGAATTTVRRAELLTGLARATVAAGRWWEGRAWLSRARELLGEDHSPEHTAPIDAIDSFLTISSGGPGWREEAGRLARKAVRTALAVPQPATACQALEVLGVLGREDDSAHAHFTDMLAVAERHDLPSWRIRALSRLGGIDYIRNGTTGRLETARHEALRSGDMVAAYFTSGHIAMARVLQGDYSSAREIIDRDYAAITRLRLDDLCQYLTMTRSVAAAHQGRREELHDRLTDLGRWGKEAAPLLVLASGLATAVCSLVEDDRLGATAELDRTLELERRMPTYYGLSGTSGLRLLLGVLARRDGWPEYDSVAPTGRAQLRWNRQFIAAARAVLLGRGGRADEAAVAVAESVTAADCFALSRHLILRLVAEAAANDGWGDPARWAFAAEEYFYQAGLPGPMTACRSIIRSTGVPIPQRRTGWERIPAELRHCGVTVREYEVFLLLADWMTNGEIGKRLFISHRTVEKHVSSLLTKTEKRDRTALCRYAAAVRL